MPGTSILSSLREWRQHASLCRANRSIRWEIDLPICDLIVFEVRTTLCCGCVIRVMIWRYWRRPITSQPIVHVGWVFIRCIKFDQIHWCASNLTRFLIPYLISRWYLLKNRISANYQNFWNGRAKCAVVSFSCWNPILQLHQIWYALRNKGSSWVFHNTYNKPYPIGFFTLWKNP
jgi:hypothetical protein